MGGEHKKPQNLQIIMFPDLPDGLEISQRLAHFPVVNIQKGIVQPVMRERDAVFRLALGDLVFMVRKNQILAAGMDINRR